VAVIHARALFVAGACTHPGAETFLRGKGRCRGADFGNDLLRRIHSPARHLRQPRDGSLVRAEQAGPLPVQRADRWLEEW
jgi:hypothetical protein